MKTSDELSVHGITHHRGQSAWLAITALNGVSALAQIGQLGIAFVLFPLALELYKVPAWQMGIVSSGLWAGSLLGLIVAPTAIRRLGYIRTVGLGLLTSVIALLCAPSIPQHYWAVASLVTGFGYGLRWIANETWLFGIVPTQAQGRIVGLHESLLGIAAIVGPALVAVLGADGLPSFAAAAAFTAAAAVPLMFAGRVGQPPVFDERLSASLASSANSLFSGILHSGPLTAGIGGLIESALISMFPAYASTRGIDTGNIAWLLSIFGLGAVLLQLPIGWLADQYGVRVASLVVATLTTGCVLAIGLLPPSGMLLGGMMFLIGGTITGFLTLGIVAATQRTEPGQLAAEMSRVSVAFTGMSVIGPLMAGAFFTLLGGGSLLIFIGLSATTLLLLLLLSRR